MTLVGKQTPSEGDFPIGREPPGLREKVYTFFPLPSLETLVI
jgi:hypothetical protein